MKEKIYVGKLEFDQEEKETLQCALLLYKKAYKEKSEVCEYLLFKFRDLKEEEV